MIWKRPEHRAVAGVLDVLDASILSDSGFSFGGGTRIVMELGEYRLSRDLDFLGSDGSGHSRLRATSTRTLRRSAAADGFPSAVGCCCALRNAL